MKLSKAIFFSILIHTTLFGLMLLNDLFTDSTNIDPEIELSLADFGKSTGKQNHFKLSKNSSNSPIKKEAPDQSNQLNKADQSNNDVNKSLSNSAEQAQMDSGKSLSPSSLIAGDEDDELGQIARIGELSRLPKVIKEFKAEYPSKAKEQKTEGSVVMDLIIGRNGQIQSVTFISGPGNGLNESAMDAIKKFEFSPALINQKPVSVKIRYFYRFKLEFN